MAQGLRVHLGNRTDWRAAEIRLTDHARDRMAERGISPDEVAEALNNCQIDTTSRQGNEEHIGPAGARRLKVVVAPGSNPPRIVSAMVM